MKKKKEKEYKYHEIRSDESYIWAWIEIWGPFSKFKGLCALVIFYSKLSFMVKYFLNIKEKFELIKFLNIIPKKWFSIIKGYVGRSSIISIFLFSLT